MLGAAVARASALVSRAGRISPGSARHPPRNARSPRHRDRRRATSSSVDEGPARRGERLDAVRSGSPAVSETVSAARSDLIALLHLHPRRTGIGVRGGPQRRQAGRLPARSRLRRAHGIADLPTAFEATVGSGDLVIGLLAEYDAPPRSVMRRAQRHAALRGRRPPSRWRRSRMRWESLCGSIGTPAEETAAARCVLESGCLRRCRGGVDGASRALRHVGATVRSRSPTSRSRSGQGGARVGRTGIRPQRSRCRHVAQRRVSRCSGSTCRRGSKCTE